MKKLMTVLATVAILAGFTWYVQRPDIASNISGAVTIPAAFYANTAKTGAWVNIAPYNAVMLIIEQGVTQETDTSYLVFQDSTSGSAVATFDSIVVGVGTDSTYRDYNYQRTANFVRALKRATGAAGDSVPIAVSVVGMARAR